MSQTVSLSKWRRRSFSAAALVLIPLGTLAALELTLRAARVGYDPSFTIACETAQPPARCDNRSFGWRFFPRDLARAPVPFAFADPKPEGSFRVFVLGGSAAQGDPFPEYGFARVIEWALRRRAPDREIEIVNAALTAVNSHVVLPIARELARYEPDLFIVYLGNNEVVGPFGAGTIFSPTSASLSLIRAGIRLRATRTGQLLSALVPAEKAMPDEWGGMAMFLEQRVRHDSPALERVHENFRRNLDDILEATAGRGAPTLLGTVAVNLEHCAPFGAQHREDLTRGERAAFRQRYSSAAAAERSGRLDEALAGYRRAADIDESHADAHFRIGRVLRRLERHPEANAALERALELDTLRFRADRRINEIIREAGARHAAAGVRLVDLERLLRASVGPALPGSESFVDHVHFELRGNVRIATALLSAARDLVPPGAPPSTAGATTGLAYTPHDRRRVLREMAERKSRPPFTGQSNHDEQTRAIEEELATAPDDLRDRSNALYVEAIESWPQDPWLRFNHAALLEEMNRPVEAASELRVFLDRLPHDVPGREQLAAALAASGRFEEAVAECVRLEAIMPDFVPPYYTRAYALASLGRLDESVQVYRRLLEIDPVEADAIYNEIGRIEVHRGDWEAAVAAFRSGLAATDEPNPDLQYNLGSALKRGGRGEPARAALTRAAELYLAEIERSGTSLPLLLALGNVEVELGDLESALSRFEAAARLDPSSFETHANRVRCLRALGRPEQATRAIREGERALRQAGLESAARALGGL